MHLFGFITKQFVTMHCHMNVKICSYAETVYLLITKFAVHLNLQRVNMLHIPRGEKKSINKLTLHQYSGNGKERVNCQSGNFYS